MQYTGYESSFVGINSIFSTLLKVGKRINMMLIINVISFTLILSGSYLAIGEGFGLLGVGWAYLIGNIIVGIFYWTILKWK